MSFSTAPVADVTVWGAGAMRRLRGAATRRRAAAAGAACVWSVIAAVAIAVSYRAGCEL